MSDFISLSCKSCGAKLDITEDIDRFACSYCGVEQIVNRSGGLVALNIVAEDISHIRGGVDRTTSELAISRLKQEISVLEDEMTTKRFALIKARKEYKVPVKSKTGTTLMIVSSVIILLMISLIALFGGDNVVTIFCAPIFIGLGVIVFFAGFAENRRETHKYEDRWAKYKNAEIEMKDLPNSIADLEKEIVQKQKLLQQHEDMVRG